MEETETSLDDIQGMFFPQAGGTVEFHASELRSGRGPFRNLSQGQRTKIMTETYSVISGARQGLTLFAAVINKPALATHYGGRVDPYEQAFEGLCTMFNFFLRRIEKKTGNVLRGIVVFDESRPSLSKQIRTLLAKFQSGGTRWANVGNLIETAFFFDSRTSRIMQLADFTAYATYRWYESNDPAYLKLIEHKFDREGQRLHGLKCYPLARTKNLP